MVDDRRRFSGLLQFLRVGVGIPLVNTILGQFGFIRLCAPSASRRREVWEVNGKLQSCKQSQVFLCCNASVFIDEKLDGLFAILRLANYCKHKVTHIFVAAACSSCHTKKQLFFKLNCVSEKSYDTGEGMQRELIFHRFTKSSGKTTCVTSHDEKFICSQKAKIRKLCCSLRS